MMPITASQCVGDCSSTTLATTGSKKITKGRLGSASILIMKKASNQQPIQFDRQSLHSLLRLIITRSALNCSLHFRPPSRRFALISGAGLAGLAASLVLRKRGYQVMIAEKRDQFTRPNVISINVEAEVFLEKFDLLNEFKGSVAARIEEHVIVNNKKVKRTPTNDQDVHDLSIPFEPKSYSKLFVKSGIYSVPIEALQTLLAKKALEMGVHILGRVSVGVLPPTQNGGVSEVQIKGIDTLISRHLHPDLFFIAEGAHSTTVKQLHMQTRVVKDECMGESWIFGNIAYPGEKTYSMTMVNATKSTLQIANAIFNARSRVINVAVTSDRELSTSSIHKRVLETAKQFLDFERIDITPELVYAVQKPVHVTNHTAVDFSANNVFLIGDAAGNYSPLAGLGGTLALTLVPSTVERLLDDRDQQSDKLHDRFRESSEAYTTRWNTKSRGIKQMCLKACEKEQCPAGAKKRKAPSSFKKVQEIKKEVAPHNNRQVTHKEAAHGQ